MGGAKGNPFEPKCPYTVAGDGLQNRSEVVTNYQMANEIWRLDATDVVAGIRNREFSCREAVTSCLERLDAVNPQLNAVVESRPDEALAAADKADEAVANGADLGLLHGVPVTIKGCQDLADWATVNGCAALKDNIASESARLAYRTGWTRVWSCWGEPIRRSFPAAGKPPMICTAPPVIRGTRNELRVAPAVGQLPRLPSVSTRFRPARIWPAPCGSRPRLAG